MELHTDRLILREFVPADWQCRAGLSARSALPAILRVDRAHAGRRTALRADVHRAAGRAAAPQVSTRRDVEDERPAHRQLRHSPGICRRARSRHRLRAVARSLGTRLRHGSGARHRAVWLCRVERASHLVVVHRRQCRLGSRAGKTRPEVGRPPAREGIFQRPLVGHVDVRPSGKRMACDQEQT